MSWRWESVFVQLHSLGITPTLQLNSTYSTTSSQRWSLLSLPFMCKNIHSCLTFFFRGGCPYNDCMGQSVSRSVNESVNHQNVFNSFILQWLGKILKKLLGYLKGKSWECFQGCLIGFEDGFQCFANFVSNSVTKSLHLQNLQIRGV